MPATTGAAARARELVESRRRLLGLAAAAACVVLAGVWLVAVPDKAEASTGLQQLAVRYGHSVCWGLLAVAAALWAVRAPRRATESAAWAALAAYAAFLVATLL